MENILNKALSEVLTPRWSEELRDAYDTGYKFSDEFELKMRELIRKTDRPKTRYIGYLAAAACAVIAIGSAVIIPAVMRSPVEVAEPEQTTVTVTENTTAASQTTVTTTSASESSVTTAESTAPDITETTSVSSEPDITEPPVTSAGTTTGTTTAEPEVTEDELDDDIDDDIVDEPVIDEDGDVENNGTQIIVDADDDLDSDDAVIDDEPIYDAPDDDIYVEKKVYDLPAPEQGETLSELFAENFPQAAFDDLWANHCYYYPDSNDPENEYYFMTNHAEYEFLHEFVQKLGSAKCDTVHPETDSTEYVDIIVKNGKPFIEQNTPSNNSVWTRYSRLYGIDDDKEYVDEDEFLGDDIDEIICFTVRVYNNDGQDFGKAKLIDEIIYGSMWRGENRLYKFPDGAVFTMEGEVIERLFDGLHGLLLPDDARTVGDINDKMNITAGNIYQAYTDVKGLYDTSVVRGKADLGYIEGFIDRYKDRPVKLCYGPGASEDGYPQGQIEFLIWLNNSAHPTIYLNGDGYCYIEGDCRAYRFKYDDGEIQRAMKAFSDVNGYDIKLYKTLGEYLSDKNFTKLDSIEMQTVIDDSFGVLTVSDKKELGELHDLLVEVFADAEYVTDRSDKTLYPLAAAENIIIRASGYRVIITVFDNDTVWINTDGDNIFRLPEGSFAKISEAVKKCKNASFIAHDDDIDDDRYDTVVPIDDDEIDE
ncbi:MAG: hypothetical protein IJT87_00510 [Ruminiclostridium sp.]|nr:hypothetical protein [Ruminiclostridium sp.]